MKSGIALCAASGALAVMFAGGCAESPSPRPRTGAGRSRSGSGPAVKLAVLPVESDQFPRVASWINDVLREVHVKGVDDYFFSKVPLEVVQLSIECVEPSNECYSNVGKSLLAQRLLLAQIIVGGTPHHKKIHVVITYFDVDAGAAQNVADRVFFSEGAAMGAVGELVAQAIAPPSGGPPHASVQK